MPVLVAIVGRPNVGKSALFNRIAGRRIAIVHDQPGVTRDRVTTEVEWRGRRFTLADTGGIGLRPGEKAVDVIVAATLDQVQLAIDTASVIVFVVSVQEGLVPLDGDVAARLRATGKPVLLAVNKADNPQADTGAVEFAELGFERVYPVSAIHGRGVSELLDAVVELLPEEPQSEPSPFPSGEETAPFKLAVVGRPNVGKSSLINSIIRDKRLVASSIPGTTRDAVDVPFTLERQGLREHYILIDTAGLRKPRRVADSIEFFSVKRAEHSIERADLVIFVLDAETGIVEQDKKIADLIVEARKACVIVVNKWDLFRDVVREARESERKRRSKHSRDAISSNLPPPTVAGFARWVQSKLFFLDYAPVIFTSALDGKGLDRLFDSIRRVASQLRQKIPTALLNRALHDAIQRRQPVSSSGARLKFFYATQTAQVPPTFLLFVNRKELFSPQYEKYLADQLRAAFGFEGCPIVLQARPRPRTVESKRTSR
ncbi:MAG: ribosome biogenesis GTPase Der [Verrucomicrobiota bacterium]|nr:ribosome biogenesis GTPase Der [Verrucomicrobiota bacterium]